MGVVVIVFVGYLLEWLINILCTSRGEKHFATSHDYLSWLHYLEF